MYSVQMIQSPKGLSVRPIIKSTISFQSAEIGQTRLRLQRWFNFPYNGDAIQYIVKRRGVARLSAIAALIKLRVHFTHGFYSNSCRNYELRWLFTCFVWNDIIILLALQVQGWIVYNDNISQGLSHLVCQQLYKQIDFRSNKISRPQISQNLRKDIQQNVIVISLILLILRPQNYPWHPQQLPWFPVLLL